MFDVIPEHAKKITLIIFVFDGISNGHETLFTKDTVLHS